MKRLFLQYQDDKESVSTVSMVILLYHRLGDTENVKKERKLLFRENFYNRILNNSHLHPTDTFKQIKSHDEIYGCDAICPCKGYTRNIKSGDFFNEIMRFLIKEKITGKKFFFVRDSKSIAWYELRAELLLNAFKKNELYVTNSSTLEWVQVDVETMAEFEIGHTISKPTPLKKSVKKKK